MYPVDPGSQRFGYPQRTSRVTPLLQSLQFAAPVGFLFFTFGLNPAVGIITLLIIGLLFIAYLLAWLRFRFEISTENKNDPELRVSSGLFVRRTKTLKISRLQAVDIHRPLLARLTGYATVQVEVAGTGDSRVVLRFLSTGEADSLRNEIIRWASHLPASPVEIEENADVHLVTEVEEDVPHWNVPNPRLAASLILTSSTYVLIVGAIFSISLAIFDGLGGLTALLITVIASSASLVTGFTVFFNFSIAKNVRGLSISHGLISTSNYTISPIRLQAIEVSQPIAWRMFHWYRVSMNVAGIQTDQQNKGPRILIPVIREAELDTLFTTLIPEWNIKLSRNWVGAAPSSRWRYPLQFRFIGTSITEETFASRTGWLTRRIRFAPHPRIQSVRITQGPIQRQLGVATLHCDSVPGPIRIGVPGISSHEIAQIAVQELDLIYSTIQDTRAQRWSSKD